MKQSELLLVKLLYLIRRWQLASPMTSGLTLKKFRAMVDLENGLRGG